MCVCVLDLEMMHSSFTIGGTWRLVEQSNTSGAGELEIHFMKVLSQQAIATFFCECILLLLPARQSEETCFKI